MHLCLAKRIYRPLTDFHFFSEKPSNIFISAASGLSSELLALATAYCRQTLTVSPGVNFQQVELV